MSLIVSVLPFQKRKQESGGDYSTRRDRYFAEREKTVAERKLTQIAMLQAAAGQKQLISVEDAVEEATALEIFTTPVKPKDY